MQWASQSDIRIATEKSMFGQPEPRWSLAAVGTIDTPERFCPIGEAIWLLLTGSRMTAQRAYDIGYVQALVPDRDALIAEVERVANEIKMCAPLAVQLINKVIRTTIDLPCAIRGD